MQRVLRYLDNLLTEIIDKLEKIFFLFNSISVVILYQAKL